MIIKIVKKSISSHNAQCSQWYNEKALSHNGSELNNSLKSIW